MSNENLEAGFYKLFLLFLEENGAKIEVTPYAAAALLLKVTVYFPVRLSNPVQCFSTFFSLHNHFG
jgi:hypothetical protein